MTVDNNEPQHSGPSPLIKPKIPHEIIKAYLKGNVSSEQKQTIEKIKNQEQEYKLLFYLIDQVKKDETSGQGNKDGVAESPTFSELENIVYRVLSGNFQSKDARALVSGLALSGVFYQRLLMKIEEVTPELVMEEVPEIARIKMRANEEIVSEIKDHYGTLADKPIYSEWFGKGFPGLSDWANKLFPQLVYVLASLLMILAGSWGGLRYYNTTYKINKAENLLTNNYQVFIENTPRLSGNYTSSGINVLMDDNAPPSYLTQALSFTNEALANGSKSLKARQLQAQIYMIPSIAGSYEIEEQIARADSILRQINDTSEKESAPILNDLGVLKFVQKNWEEAAKYFELAIQRNPEFKEAHYNLALAQHKLGANADAATVLRQYLALETDEGWKSAAMDLLDRLTAQPMQ